MYPTDIFSLLLQIEATVNIYRKIHYEDIRFKKQKDFILR